MTVFRNPLICRLLVRMCRERRLNNSERSLLNKLMEVLSDLKLTLSQCLVVVIICNDKIGSIPHLNLFCYCSSDLQPLENARRKELCSGGFLRLSGICLRTAYESLINWQVRLVCKYCLTGCYLGCSSWRPKAFFFFIPPELLPLKTVTCRAHWLLNHINL